MASRFQTMRIGGSALAAVLIAIRLLSADQPGNPGARDDRAVSAGRWLVTSVAVNGRHVDKELTDMLSVTYAADGSWIVWFKSLPAAEGTSTNDQTSVPKTFQMSTLGSGGKPGTCRTYVGIYELLDDTRRICFVFSDKPRPTEFRSTPEGGEILVTMTRAPSRRRP